MVIDALSSPPWPVILVKGTPIAWLLLVFALTWLAPRPWVSLAGAGDRTFLLRRFGVFGPIAILIVIALIWTAEFVMPWLPFSLEFRLGWWYRTLPLLATALVVIALGIALRYEHRNATGIPTPAPRRAWYHFAPRWMLWLGAALAALLAAVSIWQGALPRCREQLPELGGHHGVFSFGCDYAEHFGWAEHAPALIALAALILACIWTLSIDARHPSAPATGAARTPTAQLLCGVALGGSTVALGAVWSTAVAPPSWAAFIDVGQDSRGTLIGSDYQAFTDILGSVGWAAQLLGVAILVRLAIDTGRAWHALHRRVPEPIGAAR